MIPRLLFVVAIFFVVLIPLWRITRRIVSKAERELNSDVDQFSVDELKRKKKDIEDGLVKEEKELNFVRNSTIKSVTRDLEAFSFNTAVAHLMEFVNAMMAYDQAVKDKNELFKDCIIDLVKLLAPCAPHFGEELWEMLKMPYSVFNQKYPEFDPSALILDEIEYAIQINSKIKDRLAISKDASKEEIENKALEVLGIDRGATKKIIVVPGRLVNVIM